MWGINVGLILDEKRMMLLCCESVQHPAGCITLSYLSKKIRNHALS